jgi:hypothetical protein
MSYPDWQVARGIAFAMRISRGPVPTECPICYRSMWPLVFPGRLVDKTGDSGIYLVANQCPTPCRTESAGSLVALAFSFGVRFVFLLVDLWVGLCFIICPGTT